MNTFHQSMSQLAPISVVSELHKTLVHVSSVHVSVMAHHSLFSSCEWHTHLWTSKES